MNEEARKREEAYYAGTMKDDYISRKAVLDMLDKECGSCADTGYIFSLPGIEKRKKGKWILVHEADETGNATYECSICHRGEIHVPIVEVGYCWHCGAKMDGGRTDE